MARRLISTVLRMRGGSTLGFGARARIYDDEALTALSAIYRRSTGAGQQPNPLLPNAGRQTALAANAASGATTITVASTAGFQVGDLIPIRNATNTRYRVITAINTGTGVITLDLALDVAFLMTATTVGAPEMRGHIWGWLETVVDPFAEIEDIASGRRSPPLQIPLGAPAGSVSIREEGTTLGQFTVLNFVGPNVLATDAGGGVLNVTLARLNADVQVFTASGTWTKPAGAKVIEVLAFGAGGGGSGGRTGSSAIGGSGGGGGAFRRRLLDASACAGTETVTIGAGGVAGAVNTDGGTGGNTSFGTHLTAYGGVGGLSSGGGAGGGAASAGSGQTGGGPEITGLASAGTSVGGSTGGYGGSSGGGAAEFGGGGGAVHGGANANGPTGGPSLHGGPGGGGGGGSTGGNGGAGGAIDAWRPSGNTTTGGGGTAGGAGAAGTSRSGTGKPGGGGAGGAGSAATGGAGGAGGIPAGGAGGGGGGTTSGGVGGLGGRGEVIVVTYF